MQKEAVQSVEQDGMVFIDEIDKIVVGSEMRYGKTVPFAWLHISLCKHQVKTLHVCVAAAKLN